MSEKTLNRLSALCLIIAGLEHFFYECNADVGREEYDELLKYANELIDITEELRGITVVTKRRET